MPLLTLEKWIPIARRHPDYLDVKEQQGVERRIATYFRNRNPVKIDGVRVRPVLDRMSFFGLDINDFAQNAKPRKVSMYQARVGIILSYSTKGWPASVTMTWDTFHKYASFLRSVILVGDDDPHVRMFVPDDATFEWKPKTKREQALPARVTVKLDDATPTSKQIQAIATALLKNVYRAFDYKSDSDVYDALAQSVDGDLLRELYLQVKRSLVLSEQGGSQARVRKVEMLGTDVTASTATQFDCKCRWRVTGSVEHWGHVHTRENEYTATLTVQSTKDGWKITAYQFTTQKRIRFQTELRQAAKN